MSVFKQKLKIKVTVPLATDKFNKEVSLVAHRYAGQGVIFDVENLDYGSASIESKVDKVFAEPEILNKVKKAALEGFDGVIID